MRVFIYLTSCLTRQVLPDRTQLQTPRLLFWHLLQNPDTLAPVVDEIKSTLPPLSDDKTAYSIQGLESSLSYLMTCVRENIRINPVSTMSLGRRVGRLGGLDIEDYHIPHGVCLPYSCQKQPS